MKCVYNVNNNVTQYQEIGFVGIDIIFYKELSITRPGYLVMPDPFGWLFSENLDYFRPYKKQVETGCKGYPIQFIVNF